MRLFILALACLMLQSCGGLTAAQLIGLESVPGVPVGYRLFREKIEYGQPAPAIINSLYSAERYDTYYYRHLNELTKIPVLQLRTGGQHQPFHIELGYGSDTKLHFIQSYFLGIKPEGLKTMQDASRFVRDRVQYVTDKAQFGRKDIWLTSVETLRRGKGDCEDHAVLLADILISLGYDARIAVGQWDNGRHAWVLIPDETGRLQLIEATEKEDKMITEDPIDWRLRYIPERMFNNRYTWVLNGSRSGMYRSDWILAAEVTPVQ